jgi:hypothetical protein
MPEQNYHGPINSVINVDFGGELAAFLPIGVKLTPRAWLAPTLVDRQPQLGAIVDRIDSMMTAQGGGKLLIVVPGTRPDFHQSLVLRCGLAYFSENYDQQNGWAYLGRVAWPRGAQTILPILRKISEALALPKSARLQDTIEDHFKKLQQSVCFSHYIDASWWNDREQQLVLNWVDYVCNNWPAPAVGRFIVGFLCLDSGTNGGDPFRNLVAQLQARANSSILITDPLGFVFPTDVDDWVSEVGRYLKLPSVEAMLLGVSDELFVPPKERLRFAEVYGKLYERLAGIFSQGPVFKRSD